MIEVYRSFRDVPLDDEPDWEGDDSIPVDERNDGSPLTLTQPAVHKIVVPYPGRLHPGSQGDPVYGIKRMVFRYLGILPVLQASPPAARRKWGVFFTQTLKTAQKRAHVPVSGVWDAATHNKFAPFADAYAVSLVNKPPPEPTHQEIQTTALLSFLMGFYNRRYNILYNQARPTQLRPVSKITRADCSGSVAEGMWTANVLPKVDWRYTNTDSQIKFGIRVNSLNTVKLGDVAFYGHGDDPSHETCVVDVFGGHVKVFSFGTYPARILDIDYNRGRLGGRIAMRRFIR